MGKVVDKGQQPDQKRNKHLNAEVERHLPRLWESVPVVENVDDTRAQEAVQRARRTHLKLRVECLFVVSVFVCVFVECVCVLLL